MLRLRPHVFVDHGVCLTRGRDGLLDDWIIGMIIGWIIGLLGIKTLECPLGIFYFCYFVTKMLNDDALSRSRNKFSGFDENRIFLLSSFGFSLVSE